MNYEDKQFVKAVAILIIIFSIAIVFFSCIGVDIYEKTYGSKSLEAVTNADFTINDGHSMEAIDHAIITDMETGIQYIYFQGYGVSPYIDEDGNVSKVTE